MCGWLGGCVTEITGLQPAPDPERVEAHLDVARGYMQLADYYHAEQAVQRALAVNRRTPWAHGLLALIQAKHGEHKKAETSFLKSLRFDAHDSGLWNNYGAFLFGRSKYKKACPVLRRATMNPEYAAQADAYENLGRCWLKLNAASQARLAFLHSVRLEEQKPLAWLELARIEYQQQHCLKAWRYYKNFTRFSAPTDSSSKLVAQLYKTCNAEQQSMNG